MAFGATLSEVGRKNEIPCSDEVKSEACGAKSATRYFSQVAAMTPESDVTESLGFDCESCVALAVT